MPKKRWIMICSVCAVIVLAALVGLGAKPKLSSLPDEEIVQYLTDSGVVFPEGFDTSRVHELIALIEDDPDMKGVLLNWDVLVDFQDSVIVAVKAYYGIE